MRREMRCRLAGAVRGARTNHPTPRAKAIQSECTLQGRSDMRQRFETNDSAAGPHGFSHSQRMHSDIGADVHRRTPRMQAGLQNRPDSWFDCLDTIPRDIAQEASFSRWNQEIKLACH